MSDLGSSKSGSSVSEGSGSEDLGFSSSSGSSDSSSGGPGDGNPITCELDAAPQQINAPAAGSIGEPTATYIVSVITSGCLETCTWSATAIDDSWISVMAYTGSGCGVVEIFVLDNSTGLPRSGTVLISSEQDDTVIAVIIDQAA